jgi:DNA polymerase III delta subunit
MIYFFTWDNFSALKWEIQKWKDRFLEKFWDFNLLHIQEIESTPIQQIQESIIGQSFLWGKRLIIIEGIPRKSDDISLWEIEDHIQSILEQVPQDTILLFCSYNPDKRGSLYKYLHSWKAEVKEFNIWTDREQIITNIHKKYPHIPKHDIWYILERKWNNGERTLQEIEKLLLYKNNFSLSDIKANISLEIEESIFQLVDSLMNISCSQFLNIFHSLKNQMNFYLFYNSLLGNLRNLVYIDFLKSSWIPQTKIGDILNLGSRKFLVQKSFRIKSQPLQKLYKDLVRFDSQMKKGDLIWTSDEDFFSEIELICIKYMNI